jgi:hypothetical protein
MPLVIILSGLLILSACAGVSNGGGGGGDGGGTPPGSYNITVVGTSGTLVNQTTVNLVVNSASSTQTASISK